jgi:hypothetical protein
MLSTAAATDGSVLARLFGPGLPAVLDAKDGRLRRLLTFVPQLDHDLDGAIQCVRTVVMIADREISQLLQQQQRPRRTRPKAQRPLSQEGTDAADTDELVHRVGNAVDRQMDVLLPTHPLKTRQEQLLELVCFNGKAVGPELPGVLDAVGDDLTTEPYPQSPFHEE